MQTGAVRRYAEAMSTGAEFPPITLAHIDGSLILVDGWHRLEAATVVGMDTITAEVLDISLEEARWKAAQANTKHGLPLSHQEYREVFRAFMDAGLYRKGHSWLAYRDIAMHIGKGYSTIRNWMERDYPELFKKYQTMANGGDMAGPYDRHAKAMQRRLKQAEEAIKNTRNIGRTLDPVPLGELIETLRNTLSDLETRPYEPVIVDDFDDF